MLQQHMNPYWATIEPFKPTLQEIKVRQVRVVGIAVSYQHDTNSNMVSNLFGASPLIKWLKEEYKKGLAALSGASMSLNWQKPRVQASNPDQDKNSQDSDSVSEDWGGGAEDDDGEDDGADRIGLFVIWKLRCLIIKAHRGCKGSSS